jgi:hypothetical protein
MSELHLRFAPVWVFTWIARLLGRLNALPHVSHTCLRSSFDGLRLWEADDVLNAGDAGMELLGALCTEGLAAPSAAAGYERLSLEIEGKPMGLENPRGRPLG